MQQEEFEMANFGFFGTQAGVFIKEARDTILLLGVLELGIVQGVEYWESLSTDPIPSSHGSSYSTAASVPQSTR